MTATGLSARAASALTRNAGTVIAAIRKRMVHSPLALNPSIVAPLGSSRARSDEDNVIWFSGIDRDVGHSSVRAIEPVCKTPRRGRLLVAVRAGVCWPRVPTANLD